MKQSEWEQLSYAEKNRQLFFQQKELLDTFLAHHAISREQYDKSLGDLIVKMGKVETLQHCKKTYGTKSSPEG